ncbi:DUF481 domain-containing protein [Ferrimonas gelatinilytica]|uniref:DUF481 domain-containing protein n=1 Tax=Ferrimonas gelatinilytica TaxID=1255257 RepID=A0ABP9SFB6_9GAMM
MKKLSTAMGISLAMIAGPAVAAFEGAAELGATIVSGNTETTSIKGKVDSKHTIGEWSNQYLAETLYAEDGDTRSAERYYLLGQTNYPSTGRHYFFAMASGEIDKFSGYDYVATAALGYGHRFIEQETMTLVAEAGPGYSYKAVDQDDNPGGQNENDVIIRAKAEFWWRFSENAEFKQLLTTEYAFDGATISRSETSVSANLVGNLAMKVGYNIRHNSDPQVGKESTDTELLATLLYKF